MTFPRAAERRLTGGLCACQGFALLVVVDSVDMYEILCFWCEFVKGEEVPAWGQPLVLGPSSAGLLVVDAVASDNSSGSDPVNGEGFGLNVREV